MERRTHVMLHTRAGNRASEGTRPATASYSARNAKRDTRSALRPAVEDRGDAEPKLLRQHLRRRRRAEVVDPLHMVGLALPPEGRPSLDREPPLPTDAAGRTDSRYSASCSSNRSQHGIETTRIRCPCGAGCSAHSNASESSEPVAKKIPSSAPAALGIRDHIGPPRDRVGVGRCRSAGFAASATARSARRSAASQVPRANRLTRVPRPHHVQVRDQAQAHVCSIG